MTPVPMSAHVQTCQRAALILMGLLALWAGNGSSAAQARVVGESRFAPEAGPVLSGDRALWAVRRSRGVAVLRGDGDSPPQTVAVFHASVRLSASGGRLAVEALQGQGGGGGDKNPEPPPPRLVQPFTGPVAGPLEPLADRCASDDPNSSVAVSGDVVAYRGPGCEHIVVRDLSDPSAPLLSLPADAHAPPARRALCRVLAGPGW